MKHKFLILLTLIILFVSISNPVFGARELWKIVGQNAIAPLVSVWELGSSSVRIAKGWFTDLDVSGVFTLGGVVGPGGIDLNGNPLIMDVDGDTQIVADNDDTIDFDIGGAISYQFTASSSQFGDSSIDFHSLNKSPRSDRMLDMIFSASGDDQDTRGLSLDFDYTGSVVEAGEVVDLDSFYIDMDASGDVAAGTVMNMNGLRSNVQFNGTTNATDDMFIYPGHFTGVGTSGDETVYGVWFSATGGANNIAAWFDAGNVIVSADSQKVIWGAAQDFSIEFDGDSVNFSNTVTQNSDFIFTGNDGGVTKTTTWDLSEDTWNFGASNITTTGTGTLGFLKVVTTTGVESAPLGSEETDNTGWTSVGWTGDYDTGFIHTNGETDVLSRAISSTGTNLYQITFTITSGTSDSGVTVSIGNSVTFDIFFGGGTTANYALGIKSVSNGDLEFTPESAFDGTITNISVKKITGTFNPPIFVEDSTVANSMEVRNTLASLKNFFFGINSGQQNTTGYGNSAMGFDALASNTTGFWNVAIGLDALASNTTGSRNIAIGDNTLTANISGQRNVAIDNHTLKANTTGNNNVGIGSDVLFKNTTGYENIAVGKTAMYNNVTGFRNTATGVLALNDSLGDSNAGFGYGAGGNATGDNNTFIGSRSGNNNVGDGSVHLGFRSGFWETASNKLFIDNAQRTDEADGRVKALIQGLFDADVANQTLTINAGTFTIGSTDYENLSFDTSTTANTITLSSGTGLTDLDLGGFNLDNTGDVSIGGVVGVAVALYIDKGLVAPTDLGNFNNYQFVIKGSSTTGRTAGILLNTSADTFGGSAIVHYDEGAGGIGDLVFYTKQSTSAVPPVEVLRLDSSGVATFAGAIGAGAIAGTSLTDGTTTITGGNYTSVGNITGTDIDISAGTGDYSSTGQITIPLIETAGTTDILSIQPDATGDSTISVDFFENTAEGDRPILRFWGWSNLSGGVQKNATMQMDASSRLVFGGTARAVVFDDVFLALSGDIGSGSWLQLGDGSALQIGVNDAGAELHPQMHMVTSTTRSAVLVITDFDRRFTNFSVPQELSPRIWLHDGSATVSNRLELYHNGTDGIADPIAGGLRVGTADSIRLIQGAGSDYAQYYDGDDQIFDISGAVPNTGTPDFVFILEEASGSSQFFVLDSTEAPVMHINSLGGLTTYGGAILGDGGVANYTDISSTGDLTFLGTAGLPYAEIYAYNANNTITISGVGIANKVQVTTFDTNGVSNNATPDHTNDHITITKAGVYKATVNIHAESVGGTSYEIGFAVYKNNGATLFNNVHSHRELSGGGGDTGSIGMAGLIDLAVDDTIEVWVWNETNTNNIIIDDININLIQVGGT